MAETKNEQQPHSFKRKLGNTTYTVKVHHRGVIIGVIALDIVEEVVFGPGRKFCVKGDKL